ncbi:response regulator [Phyllobacterium sp. UNC302MFCol5.2]|uniref:response regulator transcription factor n=2 Tax=unclassified Phyllobacterium TaxID=2638441 RepID=UPI000480BF18|nr:response regulator [Phyllobacterium sp. UNC302MFCol5.2]
MDLTPLIYLVDDDERVLRALNRLLASAGYEVATYANAEDFLDQHCPERPGCAVVDLNLPGLNGFGIQDAFSSANIERPVIFLTGHGDIPTTVRAMKAGAIDFLTKPVDAPALLAAVDTALAQDERSRHDGQQRKSFEQRLATLTPREREVLDHVVTGQLNKQIAGDLGTVEKTIKVHRSRMMVKMDVKTIAELVRLVTQAKI